MKLIRYQNHPQFNPSVSFPALSDEMDRLFNVAFPVFNNLHRRGLLDKRQGEFPVDLYQSKDAFILRAELPGFRKDDIGVDLADGILTVTGHQKSGEEKDKAKPAQERRVSRAISLPENLDVEKIGATYENGVLSVTLPKREEVKPRQINVDVK